MKRENLKQATVISHELDLLDVNLGLLNRDDVVIDIHLEYAKTNNIMTIGTCPLYEHEFTPAAITFKESIIQGIQNKKQKLLTELESL